MNRLDALKARYHQMVSELVGLRSDDPNYKRIVEELDPLDEEIKKEEAKLRKIEEQKELERQRERERVRAEVEKRVKRWETDVIKRKSEEFESIFHRTPRITHCHNCKTDLFEFQESICPKCEWMRCYRCRACKRECNPGSLNYVSEFFEL